MSILMLFLYIVIIGVVVWLVETYIPMAPPFKTILRIVAVIFVVLIVLSALGLLDALGTSVPRLGGRRG